MDIDLGCRMIVEFADKERMNCQFVGMAVDEFLLLRVPLSPGIRDRMGEGVGLHCRYLKKGKIISFRAEVLRHQAFPVSLAFIGYPTSISEYNLRKVGRIACNFPARLASGEKVSTGHIVDISPSGCRFVSDEGSEFSPRIGATVAGTFVTMEGGKDYEFKGEVKALQKKNSKSALGIHFDGKVLLPEKLQELLGECCQLTGDDSALASGD